MAAPAFMAAMAVVFAMETIGTAAASDEESAPQPSFWRRWFAPARRDQQAEPRIILHQRQSAYFDIVVEQDRNDLRHLVFLPRHGSQTIIDPSDPARPVSTYLKYMFLALPALERPPQRVLFIGLGGGIMPTILRRLFPAVTMDIVELDPAVVAIAEEYFYFRKDEAMHIHIGDGRAFLNRHEQRYDLIFLDAYNAEGIPFHLTTREFYETMGRRLTPGGVISVNSAELVRKDFNASAIRTVAAALPHLAIYRNESATNYVFLASADNPLSAEAMSRAAAVFDVREDVVFALAPLAPQRLDPEAIASLPGRALILTDDFAPVHRLDAQP